MGKLCPRDVRRQWETVGVPGLSRYMDGCCTLDTPWDIGSRQHTKNGTMTIHDIKNNKQRIPRFDFSAHIDEELCRFRGSLLGSQRTEE